MASYLSIQRFVIASLCTLNVNVGFAQDVSPPSHDQSAPTLGGSIPKSAVPPPSIAPRGRAEILRHRDLNGKPCLTVEGVARPHTVNRNLYDHVVAASNTCAQRITIRVCYYRTDDCAPMEIPGGERKELILGTMPAIKDFGFEFREKF